jgi:hypothetical protein
MAELNNIKSLKTCGQKYSRPRNERQLRDVLETKPPRFEFVNQIEIYLLEDDGSRKRRVCGHHTNHALPTFVPDDMDNPHGWINPRQQRRCTNYAGYRTDHAGLGPCNRHQNCWYAGWGGRAYSKSYRLAHDFEELVRNEFLTGETMTENAITAGDAAEDSLEFNKYLDKVKSELSPEDLYDSVRSLYELEALKEMAKDKMTEDGVTLDRIESVATQIIKSAQYQATTARRDATIMQGRAVQAIAQVMVTGILHIVSETVKGDAAVSILKRIKDELVLPTNEFGYTEMIRRQKAAGISETVSQLVEQEPSSDGIVDK